MELNCTSFRLLNTALGADENDVKQVMTAGDLSFICSLHFDTDDVSDTYGRWICSLEVVSDTEDIPERSFTVYPNTLHFEGDDLYVVSITSDLDYIGHDDLADVFITIGVPADE
jgi:hypothetical protein